MRRLAALIGLVLVVAACSGGSEGTGGQLEGTRWVLRSYAEDGNQVLLEGEAYADATFFSSRVSGFAGCSTFDAVTRSTGRALLVSAPRTTLQSCGEEADAFQQVYMGLLQEARSYTSRLDTLTIFGPERTALLIYDAGPRNPLLGPWNVDSFANAPGSQVAPIEGTSLTATFRLNNVAGSAGCNTFDGTYGTNGHTVAIGRLATTRLACPDDVMTQETAFLAALSGAALVEPRGNTLLLTDLKGNINVALSRPGAEPEPSPSGSAEPTETPKPSGDRDRQAHGDRDTQADTEPDAEADRGTDGHGHGGRECDPEAHRQADHGPDHGPGRDADAEAGTDRAAAVAATRDRDMRDRRGRWRDRERQLPGRLVHGSTRRPRWRAGTSIRPRSPCRRTR